MLDQYNRNVNYIRLSITDRCNLHCTYCRPNVADHVSHDEILRYEELLRVARLCVELGITRFKITGGEPLIRKGCVDFIAQLKQLSGVEQVTMTTNGTLFAQYAEALAEAGIDCVNFSLDTVDEKRYRKLTGGNVSDVITGIEEALRYGTTIKINTVDLPSAYFDDLLILLSIASEKKIPVRFIERMPLDRLKREKTKLDQDIVREFILSMASIFLCNSEPLVPLDDQIGNGPAQYYKGKNGMVIGFIEPLHHKFCSTCNRVRLTSTGQLKTCLYAPPQMDVRALLRNGSSDEVLREALQQAIYAKPLEHHFEVKPADFSMNEVGG